MKARIRATGEIAEFSTGKNLQGEIILLKVGTASLFSLDEVEPIADIDWQHYYIQAAIAAMQGMLANPEHQKVQVASGEPFGYFYAMNAIMCTDVLIGELKKGVQDENNQIQREASR